MARTRTTPRIEKWVPIRWEPLADDVLGVYRADVPDEVRAGGVGGARIFLDYDAPAPRPVLTDLCLIFVREDLAGLVPDRVPDPVSRAVCRLCGGNRYDAGGMIDADDLRTKLDALDAESPLNTREMKAAVNRALYELMRRERGLRVSDAEAIRTERELGDEVYVRSMG